MSNNRLNFADLKQSNPCFGCPAPCCRMQLIPCNTPTSFMDLDYVRYMLLFQDTEAIVRKNGTWGLIKWVKCSAFDDEKCLCKLHNTPQKPHMCEAYDAYDCWYKNNFVLTDSKEIYRLNLERFDVWVQKIEFAENGNIVSAPDFNQSLDALNNIPIEPTFTQLSKTALASDIRSN